ncbi:MAG: hypothetical protein LBC80_07715 [Treponema sp.]|jgi:hypothetical protein|nr:hypothetical protein [Treponema sp.]
MKTSFSKKFSTRLTAAVFCFISFSLSSQVAYAQGFSSLDTDLLLLEGLIQDTIANTEEQQRLLDGLRQSLNESEELLASYESIIIEQEILLSNLRTQLNEMSETFRMQSALSARYERRLKRWRSFTLIGIPAATLISGFIGWALPW